MFGGVGVRALCHSRFSTSGLADHVFMNLDSCTEALSCWNTLGPDPLVQSILNNHVFVTTACGSPAYGYDGQWSFGYIVYKCAIIIAFLSQDRLWDVQRSKGQQ